MSKRALTQIADVTEIGPLRDNAYKADLFSRAVIRGALLKLT